jgi:hypothetical protein
MPNIRFAAPVGWPSGLDVMVPGGLRRRTADRMGAVLVHPVPTPITMRRGRLRPTVNFNGY